MTTLALSRYDTDYYYFEIRDEYSRLLDCGDFEPRDLVDLVETYPSINICVVGGPDRVQRHSELRTYGNAHPSYDEYQNLKAACIAAAIEFNSTLG